VGRFTALFGRPQFLRSFHKWATLGWLALAVPAVLWWSHSVPFLVFVSVYANVCGHWSSYQASRVEVRQDEAIDTTSEKDDAR
jgi:hypothetical protein